MTQPQLLVSTAKPGTDAPSYSLLVARHGDDIVVAAQRLRYQVFAAEICPDLNGAGNGVDIDPFDEFCDHLIVREDHTGAVVGTYRMLPPEGAREAGRRFSAAEFDLKNLNPIMHDLVETGRATVHPDHRNGAVIGLIWAGIARYMLLRGSRWLAGLASIPVPDGGTAAAGIWDLMRTKHLSPEEYRVTPHTPWECDAITRPQRATMPPLLKGYFRLGAWVCGHPGDDPEFGSVSMFVLLSMDRIDQRYLKFFLGETS